MGNRRAVTATWGCIALADAVLIGCSGGSGDAGVEATTTAPATSVPPSRPSGAAAARGAVGPIRGEGRWLVDAEGRVVLFHGVNEVAKEQPYHPEAVGFGADDATFLADNGFDVVRLGVEFSGLLPEPGTVDEGYVAALDRTVDRLSAEGIFVLFDFHQDGFGPKYRGNGFPPWMSLDDGLENPPDAEFPTYYVTNPAMQRAFESLWADRKASDGVGLQEHAARGVAAMAEHFADDPYVLGYEFINEPFPGKDWPPCMAAGGCPDQERRLLEPFYRKLTKAVHDVAPDQLVFWEPLGLSNQGNAPTDLPGRQRGVGLATHQYAPDQAGERALVQHTLDAGERDDAPILVSEFGASTDPAYLARLTRQFDEALLPWIDWSYDQSIMVDRKGPASLERVESRAAFDVLVRPRAVAVAGTPTATSFDGASRRFTLTYDTTAPGGTSVAPGTPTVVSVPDLHYGQGYEIEVTGATVTSEPCSSTVTLVADRGAAQVKVAITPGRC